MVEVTGRGGQDEAAGRVILCETISQMYQTIVRVRVNMRGGRRVNTLTHCVRHDGLYGRCACRMRQVTDLIKIECELDSTRRDILSLGYSVNARETPFQ